VGIPTRSETLRFAPAGFAPRQVEVLIPEDGAIQRPALVVFDGQNALANSPAPAGSWELHRAVQGLDLRRSVAPMVVAVPHDPARRMDELCPWPIEGRGGAGFAFLHAVVEQLLPQLRARYPMPVGALGAVLGGASWGGLMALVGHHAYPGVFGGALCLSPALWVGEFAAFDWIARHPRPTFSRIYLDCGALEAEGRMLPPAAEMAARLAARGYPRKQLWWRPDPRGAHTEADWRRRLPRALRFMFRR
jgi:enterochelin esterase-like enzyme